MSVLPESRNSTVLPKMHQTQSSSEKYYIVSVQHLQYLYDASGCFPSPPRAIAVISPDNSDIQAPKFSVTKGNGDNTYTIKVNGRDVRRGPGDLIYSFEDGHTEEWVIIFREAERAYTIESKDSNRRAWTAPLEPGLLQIRLEPFTATNHRQLFRFDSL
ncbi:hypothetical protein BKA82DRAFT_1009184 [Pisolithus tinctorius]|uniref:Uncharacterized protein n=1 Tax=Pisolithus tinctorius Marx 270 TaxID=870435 RepID=A0A0C3MW17_PISTI|nr:hypothetical protein BKA82DRAFT_1009184 [Pisolithus tinctorius]KIN93129.1 hypothetical protein M404DRAFT_1009184 [Pisolithus tinctorius Marx 270]